MKIIIEQEPLIKTEIRHNGWFIEIEQEKYRWSWIIYPYCKRNDKDCWEYTLHSLDLFKYEDGFNSFDEAFQSAMSETEYDVNKMIDGKEEEWNPKWDNYKYIFFSNKPQKPKKKYKRTQRGRLVYSWSQLVLNRDGYKCQKCGSQTDLQAHHIKHYGRNPEIRYDLANGITLCKKCHTEYHKINGK